MEIIYKNDICKRAFGENNLQSKLVQSIREKKVENCFEIVRIEFQFIYLLNYLFNLINKKKDTFKSAENLRLLLGNSIVK